MADAPAKPDKKKDATTEVASKPDVAEATNRAQTEIHSMPASAQRSALEQEWNRVSKEAGAGLPELKLGGDHGHQLAVIMQDGKATEVVDEQGKKWKPSTTTPGVFTDGKEQRILMSSGEQQPGQQPQYEFAQAKIETVNGKPIVTEITDGDNRKWTSADGNRFIGARSDGTANEGDQRFLTNDNGSQKFEDPTKRTLSPEELARAQENLTKMRPDTDNGFMRTIAQIGYGQSAEAGVIPPDLTGNSTLAYLSKLNPAALKQIDGAMHLEDFYKGRFNADEMDKLHKMLRSTDVLGDRADKMFDAPNQMSTDQAGQFYAQMIRGTNSGDMKRLNDNMLEHINSDPYAKQQYDAYVAKHQGEPGFNKDTAALMSYAETNIKDPKYRDEARILTAGADKLDTPQQPGGKTPREQLTQLAMDNKDIGMFERAMTGAPQAERDKIDKAAAAKAFYEDVPPPGDMFTGMPSMDPPIQTDVSRRNQAIARDLLEKGEVNPGSLMIGGGKYDAEKILGNMTDAQRASYVKGQHSTNPNDPDRAFYDKVHAGIVEAAKGDPVSQLRLEDQADRKGGSFISDMTKYQGNLWNTGQGTIDAETISNMSPEQRRDAIENYADRKQQLESMMKALGRDPSNLLQQFDQQFKPKETLTAQPDTSGGAIVAGHDAAAGSLLDKLTKSSAQPDLPGMAIDGVDMGGGVPQATLGAQERALMLQKAFKDDPGLLKRIQNPQTDEERNLAKLMDPTALFGDHCDQYKALLTDGRLPIEEALKLDPNASPQDVLKYATAGSQAEKDNFLKDPAAAKLLGDDPAKLEIVKNALTQGQLKPEDLARAVAIGWLPPESLKDIGGYNGASEAAYAKKYHPEDSDGSSFKSDIERKIGSDNPDYVNFLKQNENVFKSAAADQQIAGVSGSTLMGRLLGDSVSAAQVQQTASQLSDVAAKLQKEVAAGHGSPEIKAFLEAQEKFQKAISENRDAQKELAATIDTYANLAVQGLIIAGTGGASIPAMLALNTGWQMARFGMKSEMLGVNYTSADQAKDLHDFAGDAIANTAIGAVGGAQFAKLTQFFRTIKAGEQFTPEALQLAQAAHLSPENVARLQKLVLEQKAAGNATEAGLIANPVPKLESPMPKLESPVPKLESPAPKIEPTVPTVEASSVVPKEVVPTLPAPTVAVVAENAIPAADAALPVIAETSLPALAPTNLLSGVTATELPGFATKGTFDFISPGTQEFLGKNGMYGLIGGLDEKWKGGDFTTGAITYAGVGMAAHGFSEAFGRIIKFDVPPSEVRIQPLKEMPGEPRIGAEAPKLAGPRLDAPRLADDGALTFTTRAEGDTTWQVARTRSGDSLERIEGQKGGILRTHDPKTGAEEVYISKGNNEFQRLVNGKADGPVAKLEDFNLDSNGMTFKLKYENGAERSYGREGWQGEAPSAAPAEQLRLPNADAAATRAEVQSIVSATTQEAGTAEQALAATEQSLQGELASLDRAAERIQNLPDGPFKTKFEGEIRETRAQIKAAQEEQVKTQDELKGIQDRLREATTKEDKVAAEQAQRDMEQLKQRINQSGPESDLKASIAKIGTDLDAALKVPAVVNIEQAPSLEPYPVPKVTVEPLPPIELKPTIEPARIEPNPVPAAIEPLNGPRVAKVPAPWEDGALGRPLPPEFERTGAPFKLGEGSGDLPTFARLSPLAVSLLGGPIAKDLTPEGETKPKGDQVPPPEPPKLVPNQALIELGTVRNYEGPFHSADRMLQAALGHKPTVDEIRAMTKAIQEQFAAEHGGQSIVQNGLKRGDQFLRADNVEALLGKLAAHNSALANSMRSYIQSGATPAAGIHSTRPYAANTSGTHHSGNQLGGHHYRVTHGQRHHVMRRAG